MDIIGEVSRLWGNENIKNIIIFVCIYTLLIFVSRFIKKSINRKFTDNSVRLKLRSLVTVLLTVFLFVAALALFANKISGLTMALGVAGAGIAFALQEVIASLAGWFAIHFGGFFKIGDRVLLGGIKGDVIEVGFLRTTLMEVGDWVKGDQYNGRIARIANSFVLKEPVFNYSADFPFIWDEILIPVKYGSDLKKARELIKSVADQLLDDYEEKALLDWRSLVDRYVIENATVDNQIFMTADHNFISFNLRYVTDFKSRRKTKDLLFEGILQAFEQNKDKVKVAVSSMELSIDDAFKKALQEKH